MIGQTNYGHDFSTLQKPGHCTL